MKQTMVQYFEWYYANDGSLYRHLMEDAESLSKLGVDRVWMPPCYKGAGGINDVGYGVYDLYDLGEFDQKGSIRTKYGTKDEYLQCLDVLRKYKIQPISDIVFNHRMGADEKECIRASEMNWNQRTQPLTGEEEIEAWTKYTFPGRHNKYSSFQWDWTCFDGTDYDAKSNKTALYQFDTKQWDPHVSKEDGNFDYIMGSDVDFQNDKVIRELYDWGKWYYALTGVDAYRLDALKSIDCYFFDGWLDQQSKLCGHDVFAVGEYWSGNVDELEDYIYRSEAQLRLFDVPLHYHLYEASHSYDRYDMRTLFKDTLSQRNPLGSVAFVDNHDTQPGQALYSWVDGWFKVHAYALILLYRCQEACVFYGDLYGIEHDGIGCVPHLKEMMWIRNYLASNNIEEYFDDSHCIGWVCKGKHPVVVLMTNGSSNVKYMNVSEDMVDITDETNIKTGNNPFKCRDGGCSIFVNKVDYMWMKEEVV